MSCSSFVRSDEQFAREERARPRRCAASSKNCARRRVLDQAAAMQEHDIAGEPPRLAEVVRRHHDLDAARARRRARCPRSPWSRPGRGWRSARRGTAPPGRAPARARARAAAARRPTAAAPGGRRARARPTRASSSRRALALARAACRRRAARSATLPAALRRSITGRWNTMARRVGRRRRGRPR